MGDTKTVTSYCRVFTLAVGADGYAAVRLVHNLDVRIVAQFVALVFFFVIVVKKLETNDANTIQLKERTKETHLKRHFASLRLRLAAKPSSSMYLFCTFKEEEK